jgi:hypothetical protein
VEEDVIEDRYRACDMAEEACLANYKSPGFLRAIEQIRTAARSGLFCISVFIDLADIEPVCDTLRNIGYIVFAHRNSTQVDIEWRKT